MAFSTKVSRYLYLNESDEMRCIALQNSVSCALHRLYSIQTGEIALNFTLFNHITAKRILCMYKSYFPAFAFSATRIMHKKI